MDDLVVWLRVQLDEDERVAKQLIASSGGFYVEAETDQTDLMAAVGHVFRWSPARVLAEVDAKRRILELYDVSTSRELNPDGWELMKHAVRALGLPYAAQPGYREEWRP